MGVITYGDLQATVDGEGMARIVSWEGIDGSISAGDQSSVFAYRDIDGAITVDPTVSDPSRKPHAEITAWGALNGAVQVDGNVKVLAAQGLNADVKAGGSAHTTSYENVAANITAGDSSLTGPWSQAGEKHNAVVAAHGTITGDVEAMNHVGVKAHGNITGNMTAHHGHVGIAALNDGSYQGTAVADGDVGITAAGSIQNTTIEAGEEVSLSAHVNIQSVSRNAHRQLAHRARRRGNAVDPMGSARSGDRLVPSPSKSMALCRGLNVG